jgi:hypothetical protein
MPDIYPVSAPTHAGKADTPDGRQQKGGSTWPG